ncbi:uncharacterized protein JCM15063_005012 [Sporobolomyces koalae]|uniref:uncharacterized protein n=1 Tax=Sporobolomyces koalae TaxID=500713 RepID=UPI00316EF0A5
MSAPVFQVTTASPASGQSIQPMHDAQSAADQPQGTGAQLEKGTAPMHLGAKGFLMKKMAASGQSSFHSPTDTMVSPCTKKLVQSKQRHYTKGKPLSLSSSFQSSQPQNLKPKSSLGQSSSLGSDENDAPF